MSLNPVPSMSADAPARVAASSGMVIKFNGTNWAAWRRQMELSLKEKGLWQVVVRGTKAYEEELKLQAELKADAAERKVQLIKLEKKAESANNKALAKLVFSLDEHQQHLIYEENDARAAWDKMIKMFGQNTVANQMRIVQQLQHMTVEGDMNAHVSKMQQLNTMLRQMDAQLAEPDPKMVLYLLNSLRRSPEWKDQVYTLSKLKLTFADLAAHLLEEETTRKLFMDEEQSQVANTVTRMNRARRTQRPVPQHAARHGRTGTMSASFNRNQDVQMRPQPRDRSNVTYAVQVIRLSCARSDTKTQKRTLLLRPSLRRLTRLVMSPKPIHKPLPLTSTRPRRRSWCGTGGYCKTRKKCPHPFRLGSRSKGDRCKRTREGSSHSQICKGGNASCQGHWWSKG